MRQIIDTTSGLWQINYCSWFKICIAIVLFSRVLKEKSFLWDHWNEKKDVTKQVTRRQREDHDNHSSCSLIVWNHPGCEQNSCHSKSMIYARNQWGASWNIQGSTSDTQKGDIHLEGRIIICVWSFFLEHGSRFFGRPPHPIEWVQFFCWCKKRTNFREQTRNCRPRVEIEKQSIRDKSWYCTAFSLFTWPNTIHGRVGYGVLWCHCLSL